ncbi:MAG: ABC transporter permease [Verrucomicrobiota bacterium]
MNWNNIATIYGKELRDMLRDRRTLLSMIIIPTLVMPVIIGVVVFVSIKVLREARATAPSVMIVGGDDSPQARGALVAHDKVKIVPTTDDWKQQISDKKIRAVVEIPPGFDASLVEAEPATLKIYNYSGEMRSSLAVGEVRRFFEGYREKLIVARLESRGLSPSFIKPFDITTQNVAPPEKVGGNTIGGLIPYLFILLCFTGAMYPAMDLTAGEKERGTMETILCSPVARIDLVFGKFLTVLTASLGTVACSLTSMGLTVAFGGSFFAKMAAGSTAAKGAATSAAATASFMPSFDPLGLLAVVGMVLPIAVLFSAALLTISLFAKTFKEAQTYVSPLIIVIILPAVIGMLPGVELNARLALVPILNVSLVSKELVSGVWQWHYLALIFGSTCVYAAIALGLAVKMFNRESVIFRT